MHNLFFYFARRSQAGWGEYAHESNNTADTISQKGNS